MPLRETALGKICPLDKWGIDSDGGAGACDADPVEVCLECNFVDRTIEGKFDEVIDKICKCPEDITPEMYEKLKRDYITSTPDGNRTGAGFQKFVQDNYQDY